MGWVGGEGLGKAVRSGERGSGQKSSHGAVLVRAAGLILGLEKSMRVPGKRKSRERKLREEKVQKQICQELIFPN